MNPQAFKIAVSEMVNLFDQRTRSALKMKIDTSRMNPTVLVVGASGRFAGLVVPELVRAGATVRARRATNVGMGS